MKLGIIGCGNMGSALVEGVISKRILPFNRIFISDKDPHKTKRLNRKFGPRISSTEDIGKNCDFIIIAVKPQDSKNVIAKISENLSARKHLVSIMAGVTLKKLENLAEKKIAITRVMPNIAALVGKSMTVLCHNKLVRDKAVVNRVLSSIGEVIEIDERHMDAATAVVGSGPAYFFYLAEHLRDAAMKLGIKKDIALRLALFTLVGSGALAEALPETPESLRARITSGKGTTEAALKVLVRKEFKKVMHEAVRAAAKRSKELSMGA
ncbi:MAG: pyrroline-5-carboxylate reductase [Candidatus Omnitrophica bacterium]|nr:pyrroline-5-carboxylate reductase [Candidatus Omnitrophota bacterium]